MSEFKAKITAELDTSKVESQLDELSKKKIKIQTEVDGSKLGKAATDVSKIGDAAKSSGAAVNTLGQNMGNVAKNTVTAAASFKAFNAGLKQLENAVASVKELNDAMTTVHMTMQQMTSGDLGNLKSQVMDMANDLSTYTKNVAEAVQIYANANESINSIMKKSQPTVLLASASGKSAADAADTIQGILSQFHMADSEAMKVTDTLEGLSAEMNMDFAKGIQNVSDAIRVSGSVIDTAGISFEKYAAIVSATAESTRANGSKLGNAFKTIASRIGRSKDGSTTGAEKSKAEEAFNSVGVSVRDTNGDIRDLSATLDDLSKVWGTLNRSQQNYIAEQAAGVHQISIFESMMNTYTRSLELEKTALNSSGAAMKINETRADSIDGKLQKLSSTMTKLYNDAISEEAIKSVLDFADGLMNVIDKLGLLKGAFAALGVAGIGKGISLIARNWQSLVAMFTSPIGISAAGIGAVVSVYSALKQRQQELVQSTKEAATAFEESNTSLQSQIDRVKELRTQLDSGTLTEEESYTVKSELLSIQQELSESYGEAAKGLDLMNGSLETQIGLMQQLSKEDANKFLNQQGTNGKQGINTVKGKMEDKKYYLLGMEIPKDTGTEFSKQLNSLIGLMEDAGITVNPGMDGSTFSVGIDANATDAERVIGEFQSKLRELKDVAEDSGNIGIWEDLMSYTSDSYKSANDILTEYQETYNQIMRAEMTLDDKKFRTSYDSKDNTKSYSDMYLDYANAIEKYNDALVSGDVSKIQEAKTVFDAIQSDVDKFTADSAYSSLFTELGGTLDEASIKYQDFTALLTNDDVNKSAEKLSEEYTSAFSKLPQEYAKALKEMNLSDVDFKDALFTDGVQNGETAINALVKAAEDLGIITGSSADEVQPLVDMLVELGIISGETAAAMDEVTAAVEEVEVSTAKIGGMSVKTPSLDAYGGAVESANEGDTYESMRSILESTKDLYDKGLVGTDDFKKGAAVFSMSGSEDPVNFMENYGKAVRYLTEDSSGVQNFLNDLQSKGYASLETMSDGTQKWAYNIEDLEGAAQDMGMSFEWFMGMFGRLGDYGFSNDFVATQEEGISHLTDLYSQLSTAEQELAILEKEQPTNDTAIEQKKQRIEELKGSIDTTIEAMEQLLTKDVQDANNEIEAAKTAISSMQQQMSELDPKSENYESIKAIIQGQIDALTEKYHLDLQGSVTIMEEGDAYEKIQEAQELVQKLDGANATATLTMEERGTTKAELDSIVQELSGLSQEVLISYGFTPSDGSTITKEDIVSQIGTVEIPTQYQTPKNEATVTSPPKVEVETSAKPTKAKVEADPKELEVKAKDTTVKVTPDPKELEVPAKDSILNLVPNTEQVEQLSILDAIEVDIKPKNERVSILADYIEGNAPDSIEKHAEGTADYKLGEHPEEAPPIPGISNFSLGEHPVEAPDIFGKANFELGEHPTYLPPIYQTVIERRVHGRSSGTFVNGTAHADGTVMGMWNDYRHSIGAYARGNDWRLPQDEVALVNELGTESIVRNGRWFPIEGNAQLAQLKKGDIIFNARQTAELRKYGYVTSGGGHGRMAYADGTAHNMLNAYAGGGGGGFFQGGAATSKQIEKTITQTAKTLTETAEKVSEENEELFDFIEIKFNRLSDKTDEYISNAENATSLSYAQSNYQKAINNIDKEIQAKMDGAAKYLAQANAVGLNGSIAAKVRDGSIDISKFGEDTQKKIQEYQKWYDLMLKAKQAIKDLQAEQNKLAKTKLDKIVEKYDNRINLSTAKRNTYEAEMNYRETAGYSQFGSRQKYLYNAAIKQEEYNQARIHNAANAYYKEYQKQLEAGKIKEGTTEWYEAHEQIQAYNQALYESKIAVEEFNQKIRELGITKLQYALDKVTRWIDQLKGVLNLKSARGERLTEKDYMKQVTANNDAIMAEDKLLKKYLAEQRNYEYGSEKWEEFAEKIAGCKNNINELLIANEELKDSIVSARWREFDDLHDKIDTSLTEIEFLRGMLSEVNFDEEGKLTDAGAANITLIGQGMSLQKQTIADFTVALQKLDEELANGNISQDEYNVRQKEYLGIIRDAAGAVNDYEKELIDLYTTQLQAQNDAIQDEISLRSEALKKKEEYYQFDKKLRKQTKDLQMLKAQAAALEGVTTAAGKAQLAKLNAQIAEAQDNLDDTLHDHEYEFRISGYEELSKDVQEQLDETIREIETNAELQQQIVNDMLGNIKTNYSAAYSEINSLIERTGVSITDTTQSMIDRLYDVIEAAKLANEAMQRPSDYDPSDEAEDIDTGRIETDKDSNGNSTSGAEDDASKKEDINNANPGKPPSNENAVQKATKLKMNKTSLSLTVGKTYKLVVTPTPSDAPIAITWTTSSKSVATVSGGTVTAKKAGSATITAKDTRSGKSVTCKVTVKNSSGSSGDGGKNDGGSNSPANTDIWRGIPKDSSMKGRKDLDIGVSIFDRMWYNGYVGSYANQKKLYENLSGEKVHGTYRGTADQNYWMVTQLKSKGYAKGTTSATPGAHLIDEMGTEALITKYGKLVNFSGGETVFSPEQVKNLQAMSNMAPIALAENLARVNEALSDVYGSNAGGNVYIDNYNVEGVHVDGSVNNDNIGNVQEVGKQLLKNRKFVDGMCLKVDNKFFDEMKKAGFPNRVR